MQVAQAAREEQQLRKKAQSELKAAETSEAQQHVEEATVKRLEEQLHLQQQVRVLLCFASVLVCLYPLRGKEL